MNILLNLIQLQIKNHFLHNDAVLPLIGFSYPNESGDFKIFAKFMKNGSLNNLFYKKCEIGYRWETIKSINIFGIAAGLAYLHQHDFIMKNMFPYKILLDENFYPKISVYNSSKLFKDKNEYYYDDGYFKNRKKFPYIAPEILNGKDIITPLKESDVYTYSVILYQLLKENIVMFIIKVSIY